MSRRTRMLATGLSAVLAGGGLALAPAGPATAAAERVRAAGPLTSYDAVVPAGATARVQAVETGSGATVYTLHVKGLLPDRTYGAHVHVNACGPTGAAAGPHYQHVVDLVSPATDPAFANPDNEVWLDLVTDDEGNGSAQSRVEWLTRPGGAGSVTLHTSATNTGVGVAGTAGKRVGCLTVPF